MCYTHAYTYLNYRHPKIRIFSYIMFPYVWSSTGTCFCHLRLHGRSSQSPLGSPYGLMGWQDWCLSHSWLLNVPYCFLLGIFSSFGFFDTIYSWFSSCLLKPLLYSFSLFFYMWRLNVRVLQDFFIGPLIFSSLGVVLHTLVVLMVTCIKGLQVYFSWVAGF